MPKKREHKHIFIHQVPSVLELIKSETFILSYWQWERRRDSSSVGSKQREEEKNPDTAQWIANRIQRRNVLGAML